MVGVLSPILSEAKLRVLWVAPAFFPAINYGGPTFSGLGQCQALAAAGVDLRVLTTNDGGFSTKLDVNTSSETPLFGFHIRYCSGFRPAAFSGKLLALLHRYLEWADVVHLTSVYNFTTVPVFLACRLAEKPLIWSPRGALQRWEGSSRVRLKLAFEAACRAAAPEGLVLHVTSEQEARESLSRFPKARACVVPNGVNIPEKLPQKQSSHSLRLLFLGRLDIKKGIERLLEGLVIAQRENALDFTLDIAGTGKLEYVDSLQQQTIALGLADRVRFLGHIDDAGMAGVFAASDLLVVPSHTENFGRVVPEALAHGVPVIASQGTPWSGLPEHGAGWWVDNSSRKIAETLILAKAAPLEAMGRAGRAWVKEEFGWAAVTEKMLKLYSEVV